MNRLWYLGDRAFFNDSLQAQKERFLARSTRCAYSKSDIIFFAGDTGDSCFFIAQGLVRIFSIADSGKDPVFFLRQPGELFGLAEVLNHSPRRANAQALVPTVLYRMASADFDSLLAGDYALARRVITIMGSRIRYLSDTVSRFATGSVRSRLANLLIALVYESLSDEASWSRPVRVPVRISQELMASITGSTQPTISDTMASLQKDGLLRVEKRQVIVLDPMRLMAVSEGAGE